MQQLTARHLFYQIGTTGHQNNPGISWGRDGAAEGTIKADFAHSCGIQCFTDSPK